jgi:putative endonuclease
MSYFTYIIKSQKTSRYYIGPTGNLKDRLKRHNSGYVHSTKNGVPYKLVYWESHQNRQKAYRREQQIKRYKGGEAFKKLLQSSYSRVV